MEKVKVTRGRPPLVQRPVEKTVSLPVAVVMEVDLYLFSELEGKVPHGAWSRLVTRLLEDYIKLARKAGGL